MDRLTGIGVSAGIVVGRAVILTQRTEVMRFPIPPDRVDREVQALLAARDQSRQQLQDISARVAQGPGSELSDRPRRGDHPHRARQRGVGGAPRV
jgi:phosphoenolpyruvate-protein kinase (PTS system EI component)